MFWCSEREIMDFVFSRQDKFGKYKVFSVDLDTVLKTNIGEIQAGKTALFDKQEIEYKNPWEANTKSGKKPESGGYGDVPDTCVTCGNSLIAADYTHGLFSAYKGGIICEPCVYGNSNYAY